MCIYYCNIFTQLNFQYIDPFSFKYKQTLKQLLTLCYWIACIMPIPQHNKEHQNKWRRHIMTLKWFILHYTNPKALIVEAEIFNVQFIKIMTEFTNACKWNVLFIVCCKRDTRAQKWLKIAASWCKIKGKTKMQF